MAMRDDGLTPAMLRTIQRGTKRVRVDEEVIARLALSQAPAMLTWREVFSLMSEAWETGRQTGTDESQRGQDTGRVRSPYDIAEAHARLAKAGRPARWNGGVPDYTTWGW